MSRLRGNIREFPTVRLANSNGDKGNYMPEKLKNGPSKKPFRESGKGRDNNPPKPKPAIKKKDAKNG